MPESLSLLSLPSFSILTNESSSTLINSTNQSLLSNNKRSLPDENAGDADDEKDIRDESVNTNRLHRYHHRMQHQSMTSEDEDDEILSRSHHDMMDFMDQVS